MKIILTIDGAAFFGYHAGAGAEGGVLADS